MPATVPGAMIAKIAETTMADVLFIVPKRVKSLRHSAYAEDMWRRAEKIFVPERPETPLQHQAGIMSSEARPKNISSRISCYAFYNYWINLLQFYLPDLIGRLSGSI